ncbi:PH domain-containing protein [Candidatus Uhrbacteria bacterium]|nr:PH domain-containing protein [Candidatus Uhrbacteria bacterium]
MYDLKKLPNQRENEKVILFLRRQWFSILIIIVAFVLLSGVPLLIAWYFWDIVNTWLFDTTFGPIITIVGSMYFLLVWLSTFIEFTDYYLDTWIVTNERIINVEQEGLFHRTASELDLAAVQDTTAEIRGFMQTVFNYGNVFVQTAAEKERFHFININNPEHVKEIVTQLVEDDKKRLASQGGALIGKVKILGK